MVVIVCFLFVCYFFVSLLSPGDGMLWVSWYLYSSLAAIRNAFSIFSQNTGRILSCSTYPHWPQSSKRDKYKFFFLTPCLKSVL